VIVRCKWVRGEQEMAEPWQNLEMTAYEICNDCGSGTCNTGEQRIVYIVSRRATADIRLRSGRPKLTKALPLIFHTPILHKSSDHR
jgi:hypothetical protein